jgi:hypothetical protein
VLQRTASGRSRSSTPIRRMTRGTGGQTHSRKGKRRRRADHLALVRRLPGDLFVHHVADREQVDGVRPLLSRQRDPPTGNCVQLGGETLHLGGKRAPLRGEASRFAAISYHSTPNASRSVPTASCSALETKRSATYEHCPAANVDRQAAQACRSKLEMDCSGSCVPRSGPNVSRPGVNMDCWAASESCVSGNGDGPAGFASSPAFDIDGPRA